jgi:hypothetical protein
MELAFIAFCRTLNLCEGHLECISQLDQAYREAPFTAIQLEAD